MNNESATPAEADAGRNYAVEPAAMDDLALTSVIHEMATLPPRQRTVDWTERFLRALWNASLSIPVEPVFTGPDGYRYLRMQLPPSGKRFEANCLSRQAELLVRRACGVAIFSDTQATEPIYVLTMGEIESMLIFDDPRGDPLDLAEIEANGGTSDKTIDRGGDLLIGAPTRRFLTFAQARALHDELTRGWGVTTPRVGLLVSPYAAPTRALILSVTRSELPPDDEIAHARVASLAWYLPRTRPLVLRPKDMHLEELVPLEDYLAPELL